MNATTGGISCEGGGDQRLKQSREACRAISRLQARNFYWGMRLVPEPGRSSMEALYAWMRLADDLADEQGTPEEKTTALERFRAQTHAVLGSGDPDAAGESSSDIWPGFLDMARRHAIPAKLWDGMIDGQILDQTKFRYTTFEELYDYCYKVASVVGLACIEIWGYEGGEETRQMAEWRGIAFQLTNILRDVAEDAGRDRVYLPAEDFGLYELNPSLFQMGRETDIRAGLQRGVERAREHYEKSALLEKRVHGAGRPCLKAMTGIYRGLLDRIASDPLQVLKTRVHLSSLRKGWIALRAVMGR